MGQGAQVTAETPAAAAAGQVVVTAEGPGTGRGGHQPGADPGREARGERGGERSTGSDCRPFEQGDRLAAVVGPGPGRSPAGWPRPEHRVHAPGRTGGQGRADQGPGGGPGAGSAAHRAPAEAVASGWADRWAGCFAAADCFAVEEAVADGEGLGAGLGAAAVALASDP